MRDFISVILRRCFWMRIAGVRRASLSDSIPALLVAGVLLAATSVFAAAQSAKAKDEGDASKGGHASTGSMVGDPARGKELFVKDGCYECHGYLGQGGSYSGVRLAPDPLPWQAIAAFIRNPPGLNPAALTDSMMPPYSSKLVPDKDVQDIYAFLKSVPPAKDIKGVPTYKK